MTAPLHPVGRSVNSPACRADAAGAKVNDMLTRIKNRRASADGRPIAIVAARYNGRYVEAMLRAARQELKRAGAPVGWIVRVPGAFEIPVVAAHLARHQLTPPAAVIALGVILRGETAHAQLIAEGVTHALARLQWESGVPIIHGVLLLENESQARVRCLERDHNRGIEAARTALEMAAVMRRLE